MAMDARWKVYVQDRRFDDNQISNMYLKLKWETVGRFSFDFRPIDGDESYMVVNNTLRIFWGDLHKLDGVIQRVDWDSAQWCYHIYGADIRGLLLERVNTEPATVHSYTSDIQTQVMFNGCDFPTNVWTGAGENIGRYTFNYRVGIQNTIRVTGATQRWENVIERGTVYEHQAGCLYDATKNWVPQEYAGATLRFVSGACKNNVYNINGNTENRVCIRLPGESIDDYDILTPATIVYNGKICTQILADPSIESQTSPFPNFISWLSTATSPRWYSRYFDTHGSHAETSTDAIDGSHSAKIRIINSNHSGNVVQIPMVAISYHMSKFMIYSGDVGVVKFWMKKECTNTVRIEGVYGGLFYVPAPGNTWGSAYSDTSSGNVGIEITNEWAQYTLQIPIKTGVFADPTKRVAWIGSIPVVIDGTTPYGEYIIYYDGIEVYLPQAQIPEGTVPGCSRLGDIYEIVTQKMIEVQPPSLSPATLEQDNHIIHYNLTDDQSDHVTSMTVRGSG